MGAELERIRKRKKAKDNLANLWSNPENVLVVHYSCEGFTETPNSPRIVSIVVSRLSDRQTKSFSIIHMAEICNVQNAILENYQNLETKLLSEFFKYLQNHSGYTWVHWNMSGTVYGFSALEHRYNHLLNETPFELSSNRRVDASILIGDIYGRGYAEHPKLYNLAKKNGFKIYGMVEGKQEAELFNQRKFFEIHRSTERKVAFISFLIALANERNLKTNASWFTINAFHPKLAIEWIKDHWIYGLLVFIIMILSGIRLIFWIMENFK